MNLEKDAPFKIFLGCDDKSSYEEIKIELDTMKYVLENEINIK